MSNILATAALLTLPLIPPDVREAANNTSNPQLLLAVSYVESKWNVNAIGAAGEIGALQLHPKYHTVPTQLELQFKYADEYLRKLRSYCGSARFLACYNAGPTKAMQSNAGSNYTKKVLEVYRVLSNNKKNSRPVTPNKSKVRYTANNSQSSWRKERREYARLLFFRREHDLC